MSSTSDTVKGHDEPAVLQELRTARTAAQRVEIYLQACRDTQYARPEEAIVYARTAQKEARAGRLPERELHAIRMVGISQLAAKDPAAALATFQSILPRYERRKDTSAIARTLQNIGLSLRELGRHHEALRSYRRSEALLREIGDEQVLMVILNNIGTLSTALRQLPQGLECYSEALAIAERRGDREMRAKLVANIADVYIDLGEYQKAIEWKQLSLDLYREFGDRYGIGLSLCNIGRIHHRLGQDDLAHSYFEQSLAVMDDLGDLIGQAIAKRFFARFHAERHRLTEAREYALAALACCMQLHNLDQTVDSLLLVGRIDIQRNNPAGAMSYLRQALKLAKTTENPSSRVDVHRYMAEAAIATGDYPRALRELREALKVVPPDDVGPHTVQARGLMAEVYEAMGDLPGALEATRSYYEARLQEGKQIHARHNQALQMRLDIERAERQRQLMHLQNEQLAEALEQRSREVNTSALSLAQKNDLLTSIVADIRAALADPSEAGERLRGTVSRIDLHLRTSADRQQFEQRLNHIHSGFLQTLAERYPSLSASERRIASLLRLDLSSKEIADIMTLGVKSIEVYRSRLRSKLGVPAAASLTTFLQAIR